MAVTPFVDRELELSILDEAWVNRPCLVVVYGRRRIGKTRLVLEWCRRRFSSYVYYHALPAKHDVNLAGLAQAVEDGLGLRGFSRARYPSLDALLESLAYRVSEAVIVIDEFTYWARAEPRVVGELQKFVDHVLPNTKLLVIVVGSLVGVMYRSVIGGGAPLYGRARYRIELRELEPWCLPRFYPWMRRDDLVRVYALLGGVPYYHTLVGKGWTIDDILVKLFLSPSAPLRDEVLFVLREEFRDPSTYYSVLKAIAQGASTPSSIAEATGIHRQHVSKYLNVLEKLGFVEKERILFAKKSRYRIKDKLMHTWFTVIEPTITRYSYIDPSEVLPRVRERVEEYVAKVFEELCFEYVRWLRSRKIIEFDEVGKFVHKGIEIDIVALDRGKKIAYLFEVKWSDLDENDVARIARDLDRKARYLPLEGYEHRINVIVRKFSGSKPRNIEIHTIDDMPFETT